MAGTITISLDAMGGDNAPGMVIAGADMARIRFPDLRFLIFGDENLIRPLLNDFPLLQTVSEIRHTTEKVASDEKPSTALRRLKNSSMRLAVDAVKSGDAAGVVSAGNTGALMAIAKFVLRALPGVERPAMASVFPTARGELVMLDLGANIECDAGNLIEFAIMGAVFAKIVTDKTTPTVGILNVGSEDLKGHDAVREAAQWLREAEGKLPLSFHGFVEGDDIAAGTVDVVVTDGFSGNIALKTAEGTSKFIFSLLRSAFGSSTLSKLGYLLAKPAMENLRRKIDPRRYNGAMFLGLNGIAVKSHGGTDAMGFAHAIGECYSMAKDDMGQAIIQAIAATSAVRKPVEEPQVLAAAAGAE